MKRSVIVSVLLLSSACNMASMERELQGDEAINAQQEIKIRNYVHLGCDDLRLHIKAFGNDTIARKLWVHPGVRNYERREREAMQEAMRRKGCATG